MGQPRKGCHHQKHLLLLPSLFDRLIQIGPGELQAARLDPCLVEVFVTASDLGLSPALKLCHHSSHFLRSHITRGAVQGRFTWKCLYWSQETGFRLRGWAWPGQDSNARGGGPGGLSKDMLINAEQRMAEPWCRAVIALVLTKLLPESWSFFTRSHTPPFP